MAKLAVSSARPVPVPPFGASSMMLSDAASSATNGSRATNQAQTVSNGSIRRLLQVQFVVRFDTASSATNGSRATNLAQTVSYGSLRRLLSVHFVVSIRHGIFSYQWLSCDQLRPNSIQCEYRFSEFQDGFKLLAVNSISVYALLHAVIPCMSVQPQRTSLQ